MSLGRGPALQAALALLAMLSNAVQGIELPAGTDTVSNVPFLTEKPRFLVASPNVGEIRPGG